MVTYFFKLYLKIIKKHYLYFLLNGFSFFIGLLFSSIILSYIYDQYSYERFCDNSDKIYRVSSGNYGVTPLGIKNALKEIPEINSVVRFSETTLKLRSNINIRKVYYVDPEVSNIFDLIFLRGNRNEALKKPYSIVLTKSLCKKLYGGFDVLGKSLIDLSNNEYTVTGIIKDFKKSHLQINAIISNSTLKSINNDPGILDDFGDWSNLTYILINKSADVGIIEEKVNKACSIHNINTSFFLQSLRQVYFNENLNMFDGCRHNKVSYVLIFVLVFIILNFIVITNYLNVSYILIKLRKKEIFISRVLGATRLNLIIQSGLEILLTFSILLILSIFSINTFSDEINKLFNYQLFSNIHFKNILVISLLYSFLISSIISTILWCEISSKLHVIKRKAHKQTKGNINLLLQFILCGVLICFTLSLHQQLRFIKSRDLGINIEKTLCIKIDNTFKDFRNSIKDNLLRNNNIVMASFSNSLIYKNVPKKFIRIKDNSEISYNLEVDTGFFKLFNLPIIRGNGFNHTSCNNINKSIICNKCFVDKYNLNSCLELKEFQINGVIRNFNFQSLHNKVEPLFITCIDNGIYLYVKYKNKNGVIQSINKIISDLNKDIIYEYYFLDDVVLSCYGEEMRVLTSLGVCILIVILIVLVGLTITVIHYVKGKIREIAIKKVFGAKQINILWYLIKNYIIITVVSLIVSLPIAHLLFNNWSQYFYYKIDSLVTSYVITFIGLLIFTSFISIYIILKLSRINVIEQIKHE